MPKNDYEAGVAIEFSYRCSGNAGTANPVATVLDETGAVHELLAVGTGIEVAHGRTFQVTFIPDNIGTWIVNVVDDNGGDVSKSFGVATHSMAWIVDQISNISAALAVLIDAVAEIPGSGGGAHIG